MVDASASERDRTPAQDLKSLVEELSLYDERLLQKPALVFANKYDLDGKIPLAFCILLHSMLFADGEFCFVVLLSG